MLKDIGRAFGGATKARRKTDAPLYIRREAAASPDFQSMLPVHDPLLGLDGLDEEELLRLQLNLSWIYSDIDLMARETASVQHHVLKEDDETGKKTRLDTSDLFKLIEQPNPYMTKPFLLRMIVYYLNISRRGAFVFMAPRKGARNDIVELWPIPSNRIRPIKSKDNYLSHYVYTTGGTLANPEKRDTRIPKSHVIWFRYPDPSDLWASLPPLLAALDAAETYKNVSESEKKLFGNARGTPLSIVSVSADVNDPDFQTVRDQIKNDWQDGTNIAVARAGQISVGSIGFSQRDLEAIASKISTRDEIDSVFFGFPFRSEKLNSGEGLKEVDRFVKEKTIWPLLDLIKHYLTQQLARPFFGEKLEVTFDDIRTADRALTIQEKIINSRTRTINEMREDDGLSPFPEDPFPGYGELPVQLATNPSFVQVFYDIGDNGESSVDEGRIEKDPEVGNVDTLQDPSLSVAEASKMTKAIRIATTAELRSMKKVFSKDPKRLFQTEFVTPDLMERINNHGGDPIGAINQIIKEIEGG
jgi:hypothetical protein